jgi:hypothetical protein
MYGNKEESVFEVIIMNKIFQLFLLLLLLIVQVTDLTAQNQMDLISTITGDFYGALMGFSVASLDFNGDGLQTTCHDLQN